jgi:hypothetical protein
MANAGRLGGPDGHGGPSMAVLPDAGVPARPGGARRRGAAGAAPAMQRAVQLICAGAAVALISGIVSGLTTHNITFYSTNSSSSTATVHNSSSLAVGIVVGVITGLLWLWMAWKTGSGRSWARVVSTVFFGFACLGLIGDIASVATSHAVLPFILSLVSWGVGLAALLQLWKRESSDFFAYASV